MRRLQHGLGMLIAMFALVGLFMIAGCKQEETTGEKVDDAIERAEDAADDAADEIDDMADDASDALDDMNN